MNAPEHKFQLISSFEPKGSQPEAIRQLIDGLEKKKLKAQTLLGVTGLDKKSKFSCLYKKSMWANLFF